MPDPTQTNPDMYKVILENDKVRVIEITKAPGDKDDMHGHPDNIVYAMTDAKIRLHSADGSHEDKEVKAGFVVYKDPIESHSMENIGDETLRFLMIEIKK